MTRTVEAAETAAVRVAEQAADAVKRLIEDAFSGDLGPDAVLGAYATLALAASVDALREAVTDRLEEVAGALDSTTFS